uniref:Uncharacterized protein n=1 Tax=Arundo donax TaxID=35708 RepID=A0A0A9ALN2_ARUDO
MPRQFSCTLHVGGRTLLGIVVHGSLLLLVSTN